MEPYLESVQTVRDLEPEMLVTGRHEPITGRRLIDDPLARLHDAVHYVHAQTVEAINAGTDVLTMMRDIRLPPELRVGEGYGTVPWAVRTIWETYVGWFRLQSSTELYPLDHGAVLADVIDLAGADAVVALARIKLSEGEAAASIHLAEAVLWHAPTHAGAIQVMGDAHQALLDGGAEENFWAAGWLHHELDRWRPPTTT